MKRRGEMREERRRMRRRGEVERSKKEEDG
jgi:hypothetical protein